MNPRIPISHPTASCRKHAVVPLNAGDNPAPQRRTLPLSDFSSGPKWTVNLEPGSPHKQSRLPLIRFITLACLLLFSPARGATRVNTDRLPPAATNRIEFTRDIRPIFEQSCLRCHGPERPKSRFRLDNREDALKGGEHGADILPGDSANSRLIHLVAGMVEDTEMPPTGKAKPLTATEIGLLRAWIDQGVAWEQTAPPETVELALAPTVGYVSVSGNAQKFREHQWMRDGVNGGAESFLLSDRVGKDAKLTVEGRAMVDDYKVSLTLEKRESGFTRFGWEQSRKYYDDHGGYFPSFTPSTYALERDLYLDRGRAWADVGLTLPDWPKMTVGYEYDYRKGDEATLQWGPVTQGSKTRNIFPGSKDVDEHVHVIKFNLDHEIKGVHIEDEFRGEFYDLDTERRNDVGFTAGATLRKLDDIKEHTDYFMGANALRLEKSLKDWWLASAGYHYSKLNSESAISLDTLNPLSSDRAVARWRAPEVVLDRESHTFNATSLLGPWQGFTLSAGVLSEWTRQEGAGQANYGSILLPPFFPRLITNHTDSKFSSSYDRSVTDESVALRYTTIPFTTLFAETHVQQECSGENESDTQPYQFMHRTDVSGRSYDWRAGFNSSPWRNISFSSHYRRTDKEVDFDDRNDDTEGYPAFIRWRDVTMDEVEARLVARPASWLQTTLTYRNVRSAFETATDKVSGDISPGGTLTAANYDANIYSINTTVTPWRQLYLSGTFSYQDTCTKAFDNGSSAIAPYRGDVFSTLMSANYLINSNMVANAAYSYSCANYAQNNFAGGLPVGIRYRLHAVAVGVTRRITRNISTKLQYGFYKYDEPTSGGANNYTAHAIFATLAMRLP